MSRKQIPIDLMSATALASHVIATMGLDVKPSMGLAGIKAKMATAGFPTDTIEIDDGKDEPDIQRVEPPRERHIPGKRSVQLRIEPQEKPGGSDAVFTSVNGVNILVPRSTTCWLDYRFYESLKNAEAHIPETDQDSNITGYRKVPEYPISVFHIEPPLTAEEIAKAQQVN